MMKSYVVMGAAIIIALAASAGSAASVREYVEIKHELAMAISLRESVAFGSVISEKRQSMSQTKTTTALNPVPSKVATTKPATPKSKPLTGGTTSGCPTSGPFGEQFLCHINGYRLGKGKTSLKYEGALNTAATTHSIWMASQGTLSHIGQNGSKFFERCRAAATDCSAENIAMGFASAEHLFQIWEQSAPHRASMLGPYTMLGLGTSGAYATTLFR